MWVFNGEEWTQDGDERSPAKPEMPRPLMDEFVPELQVIEIVEMPRKYPIPPLPLPQA